jgi:DNA polymerase III epsilon subunit-like protein
MNEDATIGRNSEERKRQAKQQPDEALPTKLVCNPKKSGRRRRSKKSKRQQSEVTDVPSVIPSSTLNQLESNHAQKYKGRFKKLRKLAENENCGNALSGITRKEEYRELLHLIDILQKPRIDVPVQIHWRRDKFPKPIFGNQHRNLLLRLLDGSFKEDVAWASIHNFGALEGVCVVEIHVDLDAEFMQRLQEKFTHMFQQHRRVLVTPTLWFEQNQPPKSISDVLMYKATTTTSHEYSVPIDKPKLLSPDQIFFVEDLLELLDPLILTEQQLRKEKYPHVSLASLKTVPNEVEKYPTESAIGDERKRPQDMALEFARKVIEKFQVDHETGNSCMTENSKLLPFITHDASSNRTETGQSDRKRCVFALDCEMVQTELGLELARATLIELHSSTGDGSRIETNLVFDVLVRPRNPVVDYLTKFSGVTADILDDPNNKDIVNLEQVQASLLTTVRSDDILIGHSLENDLEATRFMHHKVIDTSILFRGRRKNSKHSLRHLAAILLQEKIQLPGKSHCSQEDATAALRLAVRRAVEGPIFGIFEKPESVNWIADCSKTNPTTAVCVGPKDWLQNHVLSSSNAIHALQCDNIEHPNSKAILSWLTGPKRRANLVWGCFRLHQEYNKSKIENLDPILLDISAKLQPQTLMMIAVQNSYEKAKQICSEHAVRRSPKATLSWSDAEEKRFKEVNQICQNGFVLFSGGIQ